MKAIVDKRYRTPADLKLEDGPYLTHHWQAVPAKSGSWGTPISWRRTCQRENHYHNREI